MTNNFPSGDVLALDRYCAGVDDRRSAIDEISGAYNDFAAAISERRGRRCKLVCFNRPQLVNVLNIFIYVYVFALYLHRYWLFL